MELRKLRSIRRTGGRFTKAEARRIVKKIRKEQQEQEIFNKGQKLVKSCVQCKSNCCKLGPGPYKTLKPEDYLENFADPQGWNTKCDGLTEDLKCRYWGTPKLPVECRTFVCNNKLFSKKDLKLIDDVDEDYPCIHCGMQFTIGEWNTKTKSWDRWCEACGWRMEWHGKVVKDSNRKYPGKCKTHPQYKGKLEPRAECTECWDLWRVNHKQI